MTRNEALHRIMGCLDDAKPDIDPGCDTRGIAETILEELDSALTLEPSIVEMSAKLHGVGKLSHGK